MDMPAVPPINTSFLPEPNEALHWNCSVQAGLGDTLVWTRNGDNLYHIDMDNLNDSISTEVSYRV